MSQHDERCSDCPDLDANAARVNQKPGAALANYCRTLEEQDEIRGKYAPANEPVQKLRDHIMIAINMAASEVGGLTQEQADEWADQLTDAVYDGFEGVIIDSEEHND